MRLLAVNSDPLVIEEFAGSDIPEYAILSHTWGKDEVSFQDIVNGTAESRSGLKKIKRCCEQAARDGFEYAWVDTCSIDKTSSAELQEAINSMFDWYKGAHVCYVYLEDVECGTQQTEQLRKCRWATRGWTLQELIGPPTVEFYDSHWNIIGTKRSLHSLLSEITGIDSQVLQGVVDIRQKPVAERLSWAAQRQTTRIEDEAYCLMGLFGVHMPMLYGEGRRAFFRLQEEIMKQVDDLTLFAWTGPMEKRWVGLFASAPVQYINISRTIKPAPQSWWFESRKTEEPATLTSKGLRMTLPLMTQASHQKLYLTNGRTVSFELEVLLACLGFRKCDVKSGPPILELVCVVLGQMPSNPLAHVRFYPDFLIILPRSQIKKFTMTRITLLPTGANEEKSLVRDWVDVEVRVQLHEKMVITNAYPDFAWESDHKRFLLTNWLPSCVLGCLSVRIKSIETSELIVIFGRRNSLPWCTLIKHPNPGDHRVLDRVFAEYGDRADVFPDRVREDIHPYIMIMAVKRGSTRNSPDASSPGFSAFQLSCSLEFMPVVPRRSSSLGVPICSKK